MICELLVLAGLGAYILASQLVRIAHAGGWLW